MAKRELSTNLKNLKFMQRAAQREEKIAKKEDEIVPDINLDSSAPPKRCIVITEGDPPPGAIRGRMSFLSFNPSIDKLDKETNSGKAEASETCTGRQNEVDGEADLVPDGSIGSNNGGLKRKKAGGDSEAHFPNKSQKISQSNLKSSPTNSQGSQKHSRQDKLDWKLLRPPKSQHQKK